MQNLAEREPGIDDAQEKDLPTPPTSSFEEFGLHTLARFLRSAESARLEIPEEVDS